MTGYKEVLVAVDLSDDLTESLRGAVEKVGAGANVSIVHVLEPAPTFSTAPLSDSVRSSER